MSEENNNTETGATAAGGLAALKNMDPKVLYGTIGGIVVLILAMTMMGGGGGEVAVSIKVSNGQTVTLQDPNISSGKIPLTPNPGSLGASEEESKAEGSDGPTTCMADAGNKAIVEEQMTSNYIPFVKVTAQNGNCQGKTGWTPLVNVKP